MRNIRKFYEFINESLTPRTLEVGEIYHLESFNDSGDDISTDFEYLGPMGNYDFKFRIVKSYMDQETKNKYKDLDSSHWYTPGYEFTYTVQALQYYIDKGKWTKKEKNPLK